MSVTRTLRSSSALARSKVLTIGALLAALTISFSRAGHASEEASAENKAAARDLATTGIQLAQAGQCKEAVAKLTRAEKLYHAPTILTWIGQCQIQLGRLVEGTETLNRVMREDIHAGSPDAYRDAQAHARKLIAETQPKIGKLTINVQPEDLASLDVRVDDRPVSAALVGAPRPTDPGKHVVTIAAPGYHSQTRKIDLAEGAQKTLNVVLEKDESGASLSKKETEGSAEPARSRTNWIGWTFVGTGGALLAAGGVTGILALGKEKDLASGCSNGACPTSYESTLKSARTTAALSTVLFGVGGAAAVTGIVLLITGKQKPKESARAHLQPQIGLGSVAVSGTF